MVKWVLAQSHPHPILEHPNEHGAKPLLTRRRCDPEFECGRRARLTHHTYSRHLVSVHLSFKGSFHFGQLPEQFNHSAFVPLTQEVGEIRNAHDSRVLYFVSPL
jgi:hypothetical protein